MLLGCSDVSAEINRHIISSCEGTAVKGRQLHFFFTIRYISTERVASRRGQLQKRYSLQQQHHHHHHQLSPSTFTITLLLVTFFLTLGWKKKNLKKNNKQNTKTFLSSFRQLSFKHQVSPILTTRYGIQDI